MFLFQYAGQKGPVSLPLLKENEADLARRVQTISTWVRLNIGELTNTPEKQALYSKLGELDSFAKQLKKAEGQEKGRLFGEAGSKLTEMVGLVESLHSSTYGKGGPSAHDKVYSGKFATYLDQTMKMAHDGIQKLAESQKLAGIGDELWLNTQVANYNKKVNDLAGRLEPEMKKQWKESRFFVPSSSSTETEIAGKNESSMFRSEAGDKYRQLKASLLAVTREPVETGPAFVDPDAAPVRRDELRVDLQSKVFANMPKGEFERIVTKTAGVFDGLGEFASHLIPYKDAVFTMVDGALMIFKEGKTYKGTGLIIEGFGLALIDYAFLRGAVKLKSIQEGKVGMKEWTRAFKQGLEEGAFKFEGNKLVLSGFEGAEKYTAKLAGGTWEFSMKDGRLLLRGPEGKVADIFATKQALRQMKEINGVFSEITKNTAVVENYSKVMKEIKDDIRNSLVQGKIEKETADEIAGFVDRLARKEKFDDIIKDGLTINGEKFSISYVGGEYRLIGVRSNKVVGEIDDMLKHLKRLGDNKDFANLLQSNTDALASLNKIGMGKDAFNVPLLSGTSWGGKSPRSYNVPRKSTPLAGLKGEEEQVVNGVLVKNSFKPGTYKIGDVDCVVKATSVGKKEYITAEFNGNTYLIETDNARKIMKALNSGNGKKATKLFESHMRINAKETAGSVVQKLIDKKTEIFGSKLEFLGEEEAKKKWTDVAKGSIIGRLPKKYGGTEEKFQLFMLTEEGFRKFMESPARTAAMGLRLRMGQGGRFLLYVPEGIGRGLGDLGSDLLAGPVELARWISTKDAGRLRRLFEKAWTNVAVGHPVGAVTLPYIAEKQATQYFIYNSSDGRTAQWLDGLFEGSEEASVELKGAVKWNNIIEMGLSDDNSILQSVAGKKLTGNFLEKVNELKDSGFDGDAKAAAQHVIDEIDAMGFKSANASRGAALIASVE